MDTSCCTLTPAELLNNDITKLCTKCKRRYHKKKDYEKHKEKRLNTGKEWREKNLEHCKNRDNNYHAEHKEQRNESCKKYYEENREKIREHRKKFYQENKEKINEQRKKYRQTFFYKVSQNLRKRTKYGLGSGEGYNELLGCTYEFLNEWFQFIFNLDFQDEMTFDNYGSVWEMDHVKPVSSFNLKNQDEINQCFNWKNLSPLLSTKNRRKNRYIKNINLIQQEIRVKLFLKQKALTTAN
jgi:hypothetical protein